MYQRITHGFGLKLENHKFHFKSEMSTKNIENFDITDSEPLFTVTLSALKQTRGLKIY